MNHRFLVPALLTLSFAPPVLAEPEAMEEMVVTAVRMSAPLEVTTDPKAPRQPLPANDGADYLKTIPGFSVVRKGGTDGDPLLRGMGGSRLSILVGGEVVLGGCSNRMDPPTAYVFPETFDTIRVIKGPQTVQHGPGNSAGAVLFERDHQRPTDSGFTGHASVLGASASRQDGMLDVGYSSPEFAVGVTGTTASADNYVDGDGVEVHSAYDRWSGNLRLAYTPTDHARVELNAGRSDGEAAYADRGVDGAKFARDNLGLTVAFTDVSDWVDNVTGQVYYNYVDHVMDNYSLRDSTGVMPRAMNPDRETTGGKLVVDMFEESALALTFGMDAQRNRHTNRMTMNQRVRPYESLPRVADARFSQVGLFAETIWKVAESSRVLGGLRVDDWSVTDPRQQIRVSMMAAVANPTANVTRDETLTSGFARFESDFVLAGSALVTAFAGVGRAERFPDYWEMIARETADSVSALWIAPEQTDQVDIGALFRSGDVSGSASLFYNEIDDYLLIESGVVKPMMMATRTTTIVRNIDARSWGFEVDAGYRFADHWKVDLALASVRGANDTDNAALPQLPPLETRLALGYDNRTWSVGVLWRALAAQDRVDPGKGNIIGQDIGPTASANIVSLNAGWRVTKGLNVTAGVDNLLDETYAEHISRAGASIPGFTQTTRVNEPGRTAWLKAQFDF